jgi:hypothetical protein
MINVKFICVCSIVILILNNDYLPNKGHILILYLNIINYLTFMHI